METEESDDMGVESGAFDAIIDSAVQSYFGGGVKQHKKRGLKKRIKGNVVEEDEENQLHERDSSEVTCVSLDGVRELLETTEANINANTNGSISESTGKLFREWCEYMDAGFNLLLYGCGSKMRLLQQLCASIRCSQIQVHGYETDTTLVRRLLIMINERLQLSVDTNKLTLVRLAQLIVQQMSVQSSAPILLVVHSLDGAGVRDAQSQAALLALAQAPNIRMLTSIDHVNASLLISQQDLIRCKFVSIEASTFVPYTTEVLAGSSKLLGLSGQGGRHSHTLASLESFWASLTENAKQMFVVMVRAALGQHTAQSTGISFWQLYSDCKAEFIVSSELQLQQQLVEFCDHNLVQQKKSDALGDRLLVTVDMTLLKTFLTNQGFAEELEL